MPEATPKYTGREYRWTPNFPGIEFMGRVIDPVTNQIIEDQVSLTSARTIWPEIHDGRTDAQLEAHSEHWSTRYAVAMTHGRKVEATLAANAWWEAEVTRNARRVPTRQSVVPEDVAELIERVQS